MTFGGSGTFATMGSTSGAEARREIDMCLEADANLFDTADIYSAGESEVLLSEPLGARR
jgi:aryl-alcohol dehydrogenase-like predicted oxidoreductase